MAAGGGETAAELTRLKPKSIIVSGAAVAPKTPSAPICPRPT